MTRAEHSDMLFTYWLFADGFSDAIDGCKLLQEKSNDRDRQEICEQLLAKVWGRA